MEEGFIERCVNYLHSNPENVEDYLANLALKEGLDEGLVPVAVSILDSLIGEGPSTASQISRGIWKSKNFTFKKIKSTLDFLSSEIEVEEDSSRLILKLGELPESFSGFDRTLYEISNSRVKDIPFDWNCLVYVPPVLEALDKRSMCFPEIISNVLENNPSNFLRKKCVAGIGELVQGVVYPVNVEPLIRTTNLLYRKNIITLDNGKNDGGMDYLKLNYDFFNQKP